MRTVELNINGKPRAATAEPRTHLADFLRESHNLTGTHIGCEHGVCGACTLLVDGVPTRSCITYAIACERADVTTIEGLDEDAIATELRTAFRREHALQCGYCTPGMIISARDVVLRFDKPTEHEIRVAMSGNLCRCTGYVGIVRAIQSVIEDRRSRGVAPLPGGGRKALGPAGSGHAASAADGEKSVHGLKVNKPEREVSTARAAGRLDPNWKPQTTFTQSFTVEHSPDAVWAFFSHISEVASCLPGASLIGEPVDGRVEGRMKVKVGPISAEFQGVADVGRDEATRTGTIVGSGSDRRSNSATRGQIAYTVTPGNGAGETRVNVTVGFTLSGMLAQFGRSGLVQDVANRMTAAFIANLEAKLSSGEGDSPVVAREFDAGSLVFSMMIERIRGFLGIFRRRR